MYPNEVLESIHGSTLEFKRHLVDCHGDNDMPPMLSLGFRDDHRCMVDMGDLILALAKMGERMGIPDEAISDLTAPHRCLRAVLTMLSAGETKIIPAIGGENYVIPDSPLESVWFAVEQFMAPTVETEEEVRRLAGTLQHDFETNPASKVMEMVTTYIIETGADGLGEWARLSSPHRKADGGKLEYLGVNIRRSDENPLHGKELDGIVEIVLPYVTRESLA